MAQTRGTLHPILPMQCLATSTLGGWNNATVPQKSDASSDAFLKLLMQVDGEARFTRRAHAN